MKTTQQINHNPKLNKKILLILLLVILLSLIMVAYIALTKRSQEVGTSQEIQSEQQKIDSSLSVSVSNGGEQPHQAVTAKPDYEPSNQAIHNLVNEERAKAGVAPVTTHENLNKSALDKCNDMVARDYWNHNAPDGSEPWVFIKKYTGNKYTKLGENLSYGQSSDFEVVDDWLNSPTHKANMLDGSFIYDGIGTCKSENYIGDGRQTIIVHHLYQ